VLKKDVMGAWKRRRLLVETMIRSFMEREMVIWMGRAYRTGHRIRHFRLWRIVFRRMGPLETSFGYEYNKLSFVLRHCPHDEDWYSVVLFPLVREVGGRKRMGRGKAKRASAFGRVSKRGFTN
jgi:hypothetical protein